MSKEVPVSAAPKKETKVIKPAPPPTNIKFVGQGADQIKFTVDPKAKQTVVYANGIVVSSY